LFYPPFRRFCDDTKSAKRTTHSHNLTLSALSTTTRSSGVTYTVTSGAFAVVYGRGYGGARYIRGYIDGVQVLDSANEDDNSDAACMIVPRGSSYSMSAYSAREMIVG
jgi:hypothetical protein